MYIVLIPIVSGLVASWLINYLADVLPDTLTLGQPVCTNHECKRSLPWKDYLLLRACHFCGQKRRLRTYVIIVLSLGSALYLWFAPIIPFWLGYPILAYLLTVAIIDIEHRLVLGPLSIAGVGLCTVAGIILHDWLATLIGGAVGFLIMWLLYLLGRWFSRLRSRRMGLEQSDGEEALGAGDVTMATILGLLLGWPLIWNGLLLGILLAGAFSLVLVFILLISRKYKDQAMNLFIAYVPFFITAAMVLLYLPNRMITVL